MEAVLRVPEVEDEDVVLAVERGHGGSFTRIGRAAAAARGRGRRPPYGGRPAPDGAGGTYGFCVGTHATGR
ncbi:hypothetical protein GCM10010466_40550 [Planomonospora alba]|uniref:Uncharacterized protein n=1 Tax=Planomonospora alba TaxID=161354 RepID=A0ABP6NEM9_9ACTN